MNRLPMAPRFIKHSKEHFGLIATDLYLRGLDEDFRPNQTAV
jgi:hypothetical protein